MEGNGPVHSPSAFLEVFLLFFRLCFQWKCNASYRSSRQFGRQGRFHKCSSLIEWQTCLLCCTQKSDPSAMVDTHKSRSVVKFYSLDSQRNLGFPGILKNSSCVELECGTTPAGRRRSSSILREVLMAHFPASLFMSRLAGSAGTKKVCEASKSRNRTGSVISKSGLSGLSQMPAAMTHRGLRHQSLLELIASFPPSHNGNRARRQQGPRGPQRSQGQPSQ